MVLLIRVYSSDSGQSNKGSTKKEIENNSIVTKFQADQFEEGASCVICISEYEKNEKIRTLTNCNHNFHKNCIDKWLKSKGKCPLCVQSISKEKDFIENKNEIEIQEN